MRNNKAIAVPLFAIITIAILAVASLVIDSSYAYSVKTRIKNAVDLSSLAGISQLTNTNSISNVKNTSLQYLNNNLIMTLNPFSPLTLDSQGLMIEVGVYDFNAMTFTVDEQNPNLNALRVVYSHTSMTLLANILMISNIQISDSSTSAKQAAGNLAPGGGFPLAINKSVLPQARLNNNNFDLTQSGEDQNSYFTSFKEDNANANDISDILDFFEEGGGLKPSEIRIGEEFQINNGVLASVYMDLNESFFEGMIFISPVVTLNNFSNMATVEGFVGFRIRDIYMAGNDYHIAGAIIPSYIDNNWSGLTPGGRPNNIPISDQGLLANGIGLVEWAPSGYSLKSLLHHSKKF